MLRQLPLFDRKFFLLILAFDQFFSYKVTKTATGINVKVEADLRWKQTVVDAIKPSIQADVHRSMESFGKSLHAGLLAC